MLDLGELAAVGVGCGRLVGGHRTPIVARQGREVAERGLQLCHAGIAERERCAVVRGGLDVRVEPSRTISGEAVALRRGQVVAGRRQVVCDRRGLLLATSAQPEGRGRTPVEQPTPSERHLAIDEIARLLVAEVVGAVVRLEQQATCDELLERGHRLVVGASARVADGVRVERQRPAPPLPRRPGCRARRERRRGPRGVAHPARHRPVARQILAPGEGVEVLHDEEREATALPMQLGGEAHVLSRQAHERPDLGL